MNVLEIGSQVILPGTTQRLRLPAALLPTQDQLELPLTVINANAQGPRVWLSAAVHGDELNGVEVIRRVLIALKGKLERGVIIAVPIVNVFGFIHQSRYLPDRRDLNRSFPGSRSGSLAGRLAHLFMSEVVAKSTHGIDLHTASNERTNLPQIRGNLQDPETLRIACAFGAPAMLHSSERDGSLRAAATKRNIPVILYEAGEPQRFNEDAIRVGVRGCLNVLEELGMLSNAAPERHESVRLEKSQWIRARSGGLLRLSVGIGDRVEARQPIGVISDPFGDTDAPLKAPFKGLVIGATLNPVVYGGDGLVHIGRL